MSSKTTTTYKIDPYLAKQSKYGLSRARGLRDRSDPMPSQYVGISDPRQSALDQIMGISGQRGGSMVPGAALGEWQKTLQGGYLDANPYIDDIVGRAAQQAGGSQVGGYATQGRFGSGAMANAVADATMSTASNLYGANYQNERNRMMGALGQSGAMEALQYADAARQMGVGQQYEADQSQQAMEAMRQYVPPYMQQQMYEGSLASNPLNKQGTQTSHTPFDWGGAMMNMAGNVMKSDRSLKKNITPVGESPSGIPTYTFEYLDEETPGVFHGVMAQDIEGSHPAAVASGPGGYLTVNYSLIDADFYRVR